ncbi:hypothetical protein BRAS3843_1330044 [Bradyrhizobium sp. STM 3843]|nr:hypothetical protein BRAS3843_1330044 [Bradyrhizobium sp. STM 3843]
MALTAASIRALQSMVLVVLVPEVVRELELEDEDDDDVLLVLEVVLLTVMIAGPP